MPNRPLTAAERLEFSMMMLGFGVFVEYGELNSNGRPIVRFMPMVSGRAQLNLPTDATWYQALHEAGHFRDWNLRGRPGRADWLEISYHKREQAVYDWLKRDWWDELTPEQQSDAFLQWMVEYQKFLGRK